MLPAFVFSWAVPANESPSLELLEYLGDSAEIDGEMFDPMLLEAGELPALPIASPAEAADVE